MSFLMPSLTGRTSVGSSVNAAGHATTSSAMAVPTLVVLLLMAVPPNADPAHAPVARLGSAEHGWNALASAPNIELMCNGCSSRRAAALRPMLLASSPGSGHRRQIPTDPPPFGRRHCYG